MQKIFRIIHLGTSDVAKKQKLMNALLIHNITCFGMGPHLLIIDMKPEGTSRRLSGNFMNHPVIKKNMKACQADLLSFDKRAFQAFQPYLSKEYVFKGKTKNSMTYHSKTQKADFTVYHNGIVKTSKDLWDVPLLINLTRICYGEPVQKLVI